MLLDPLRRFFSVWLAPLLVVAGLPLLTPVSAREPSNADKPPAIEKPLQPMIVARLRSKDRCGSRCPEWIVAEGVITPNTPANFRRLLAQIGGEKLPVVLDSPGGDFDAALEIGRMIRDRGLTTIIGRTEVQGCAVRDAACMGSGPAPSAHAAFVSTTGKCDGSCLLVLAAGVQRIGYWVAEARFPAPDSFKTRTAGANAAARVTSYLADMGISAGLLPRLRRSSLPLDRAEMLHFGLSTGRQRVEDFTGSSICLRAVPAANCLLPPPPPPPPRLAAKPAARKQAVPLASRVIIWGGIEDM